MTSSSLSFLYFVHSIRDPAPVPLPSLHLCCVFLIRPFIRQRTQRTKHRLKLASVPKSVGTPGGQIGGVVPPGDTNTHTHTCRHRKSPTHFLRHSLTKTHTFPSSHQSIVTIGLGKTKYRLPPTLLTDRLPLR